MLGVALDGLDKIGDEVEAALILHLHLAPLLGHALVEHHQAVACGYVPAYAGYEHHHYHGDCYYGCFLHSLYN